MRKKRILLVLMALILILPSFLVHAATNESMKEEEPPNQAGNFASKDEVVYATLSPAGDQQETYVVNIFDVVEAGKLVDYGPYTSVKNLSDLSKIQLVDKRVELSAPKGKFYYQGNMNDEVLPWDIAISYLLDGKKTAPGELVGKDGNVQIDIHTTANEQVNPVFFEHYLLQITLTLEPDIFSNIEAPVGMIANAGKNKQITFTVMPEKKGVLSLKADVVDFELQGIEIAAVPSSMSIDAPDMDEMTGDMESLTDAIAEVNTGVGELKKGVSQLNNGVASLRDGSTQYKKGMSDIKGASSELVDASGSINEALATISSRLSSNSEQMDLSGLENLTEGLSELTNGLSEMVDGLAILRENYAAAYSKLDGAMMAIPEYRITEEEIQSLHLSGADPAVLEKLVETYSAAHAAKGTYSAVKEGFDAVDATFEEVSGAIREIGTPLDSIVNGISFALEDIDGLNSFAQLQEGIAAMAANYGEFHSGLVSYTKGVDQLSDSYNELHSGIVTLSQGSNEFETGVGELHNGTGELYKATNNLPEQMQEEIDKMIAEYDKSDFDAVSFVSTQNEKVNSVQFVIKTESIKKEEQETSEETVEEKGFWGRLLDLFF